MKVTFQEEVFTLPWLTDASRRRAKGFYNAWVRGRRGGPWELPACARTESVQTPLGALDVHSLPGNGRPVVLVHPDRRYGGHWFVKEGWVQALHAAGRPVYWFDQPGYGQGLGGSPYLAENVGNVVRHAGGADVVGLSLGAFAASIAAPHLEGTQKIVLESPYVDFNSWYDRHGWSLGKAMAKSIGLLFPGARNLNARDALRDAPQDIMVALSQADTVTPPELSEAVVDREVTWYRSAQAEHLHLWREEAYQEAVLAFLRD